MSNDRIMKKIENIPKKNIYQVPDGYFDKLPGIIQTRVAKDAKKVWVLPNLVASFKYALPVMIIGIAGLVWFNSQSSTQDAESLLATVETEDLIAYIESSDISTDELLNALMLDALDATEIENEVYGSSLYDEELDALIEEFDIDINNL